MNCLNLKSVGIKSVQRAWSKRGYVSTRGARAGELLLVPPPPIRNMPLVTTVKRQKATREGSRVAEAFLILAWRTSSGLPFPLRPVLHLLF